MDGIPVVETDLQLLFAALDDKMNPIYRSECIHDKNLGGDAFLSANGNQELVLLGIDRRVGSRNGIACLFQTMRAIFGPMAGSGMEID
jgi:hypothetical protein